jgi:transketolase C-terminal domain/subunit
LIAWELDDDSPDGDVSSGPQRNLANRIAHLGTATRLDYFGPIPATDSRQLVEMLSKAKDSNRPTLLHLTYRRAVISPAEAIIVEPLERPETRDEMAHDGQFRQIANLELSHRAVADARIVAVAASVNAEFSRPWSVMPQRLLQVAGAVPSALQWSAAVALDGSRPFVFLSLEQLTDSYRQLEDDICLKHAPVTLIVERDEAPAANRSRTAALAGLRQFSQLSLLSPKDGAELRQMIGWCAASDGPAVIWLPHAVEPQFRWQPGPALEMGKAEQLAAGQHVAIVAWGPMVAAAQMAAECLALHGLESAVVNARFAQPLDAETIVRVVQGSLCAVVIDDNQAPGGFSSSVLDHLRRGGVTQPVAIVTPEAGMSRQNPHNAQQQCALRIVEQCRWLADPVQDDWQGSRGPVLRVDAATTCASPWWNGPNITVAEPCDEQRQVLTQQFSPFVEQWVRGYAEVGQRDLYLWRWCLHGLDLTTLSCVAPSLRRDLCDTKLLAVMYGVMLDDVADQGGAEDFLNELAKIISGEQPRNFDRFTKSQQAYAQFTCRLWEAFEDRLRRSPGYSEFEDLLTYDHRQILNTMSYSCMVNRYPEMLNVQEHDMYLPHNMQMMSFATMDLMCSPTFDRNELGKLRQVIWHAQSMGRIGNLVSTWQREIADHDFTSGVFARALCEGDLTLEDLRTGASAAIERVIRSGGHELYFLEQWEAHRSSIRAMVPHIRSVDVDELLVALQRLIHMELGSRGFK